MPAFSDHIANTRQSSWTQKSKISHHIYQFCLHYKVNLFWTGCSAGPSQQLTDRLLRRALWSRRLLLTYSTPGASSLFGVKRKYPQRQSRMRLGTHQSEEPGSSVDLNKPWTTVYRAAEREGVAWISHITSFSAAGKTVGKYSKEKAPSVWGADITCLSLHYISYLWAKKEMINMKSLYKMKNESQNKKKNKALVPRPQNIPLGKNCMCNSSRFTSF